MNTQPDALDLADALDQFYNPQAKKAAAELRHLHEVNQELVAAVEQAVEGSWLDPQGLNHDDDSLFYIAREVSDKWGKPQLMAHIQRLSAALAKARGME
jgi:murein endopeptidase